MIKTLSNILKQDREAFIIPKKVQDMIPIQTIWPDGIFLNGKNKFSKMYRFTDINYAVASRDDKEGMFLEYSELLNSLDSGSTTKITINNRRLNRLDFEEQILIQMREDGLNEYREEYNQMLLDKATGSNAIIQDKYVERKDQDLYLPRFLLMENVPALNNGRHKKNFEEWKKQLEELGYYNKQYLLNAKDFGLPQNRERLLMLSILTYNDEDVEQLLEDFFNKNDLESSEYRNAAGIKPGMLSDFLRVDYNDEKYLKEAEECQPNKTVSRMKIWEENPQLTNPDGVIYDNKITATITTKQDRHPNSGNLAVPFQNGKAPFRYLTPRECFLLMGFKEEEYDRILDNNFKIKKNSMFFTRDNLIKMAGNSIAVNVLSAIFHQIVHLDEMLFV